MVSNQCAGFEFHSNRTLELIHSNRIWNSYEIHGWLYSELA